MSYKKICLSSKQLFWKGVQSRGDVIEQFINGLDKADFFLTSKKLTRTACGVLFNTR
jgi:hypothetical protein